MKPHQLILIVEDDEAISRLLQLFFKQHGHKTLLAKDRKSALREIQTRSFDIILLDLGLPDGDGKELIATIRTQLTIPIIIVSARSDEAEIIAALDAGADDYITKPFSTNELFARVRSAQRRFLVHQAADSLINCEDIVLNIDQFSVTKANQPLKLTPTEFNLLKFLMLNRNQVLTHTKILKEVWGINYQHEMQYLRTYINNLRKKIEPDLTSPLYIQTELGIGYRFLCRNENQNKTKHTHLL
jgi:two-component system, OmpR family, KDP operon response regulator KdpE